MYICLCNAVTDTHIREAVENGATRMRDLNLQLGVASECGKCACCAHQVLKDALAEASGSPTLREAA
ncbi:MULTISPECIES: bacterioferritin-associated ferredoxin [Gulbenkiania]|uniref:Bacterioferritin-associated ferredoxin n=2 Tax=Gulbenkiania TaxID=397456 RepID=A0A0K6H3Z4_9NEIS|nr:MULTISPECIES: bacterioferritin-associated ferredoxin [Gulbenkiania]TCW30329.1 bacterioferritin-associated ferredoxin [Gulbenkiania mobilis]CUA85703.1 Bacterioferritin-associated ferredoxin [Gulbenkiania indica]